MPGRPKSIARKKREHHLLCEKWMAKAVELYEVEQLKDKEDHTRMGLREVCRYIEGQCWEETKVKVHLDKMTLSRRLRGIHSQAESNAEKGWLTTEEEKVILDFTLKHAQMGWPLSRRRIEEHANEICRGRYGDHFDGLGKNWTKRFVQRHCDVLKGCWTRPLEGPRARAGNPVTKKAFFDILEQTINGGDDEDPIPAELIYGADESGFQQGVGTKEWAYGGAKDSILHQQRSGSRENITVMVTICADGTSIPPAVIFKGEGYQVSWKQDNPLKASLGYSKKGYLDGEIGVEWIKQFDECTREKAAGRQRLLLVDGFGAHYTHAFLKYARENKIHILCYPSHSTHLYQGLDVVIFSIMKTTWGRCRDALERDTNQVVDKTNFLSVYADAHLQTLTKENIVAAFKATGIVPFNPDVITTEMLAPSITTSTHGQLPLPMESPVRVIYDMLDCYVARQSIDTEMETESSPINEIMDCLTPATNPTSPTSTPLTSSHTKSISTDMPTRPSSPHAQTHTPTPSHNEPTQTTPIREAVQQLRSTSASFLVSAETPRSTMRIPTFKPYTISPFQHRYSSLINRTPATAHEEELRAALEDLERRDTHRKHQMVGMQAHVILQGMHVGKIQRHLQAAEEKRSKKKSKKIVGDGMPRLMSGDNVFAMIDAAEKQAEKEAEEKEERRIAREEHREALARWKAVENQRKERNKQRRAAHQASVKAWEAERDLAKTERRLAKWSKPRLQGIEKPIPRPSKPAVDESEDEDHGGDEEMEDEVGMGN
ncbi:hypothetical protein Hypma_009914 [Hypsizygus marmoreus]|uniref:HTH CENPB-type domain-containing protein n=1 Tax=Hypsizygus marmoreus TaxID=39966 RepID=A0A369JMA7_HYPMA|nr:hypothetical protein Hypma_009914 [Hypsizygus marmoreus]